MKLSLRFILPLLTVLLIIAIGVTHLIETLTLRWFTRDLEMRSVLIANTLQDPLIPLFRRGEQKSISNLLTRVTLDDRLLAIGHCDSYETLQFKTQYFPPEISCKNFFDQQQKNSSTMELPSGLVHIAIVPLKTQDETFGHLLIIHDMSFIYRRIEETKRYIIIFFILQGLVISIVTVLIAQINLRGWVFAIRSLLKGGILNRTSLGPLPGLSSSDMKPIIQDLRLLVKQLRENQRMRDESLINWSPQTLKEILSRELAGEQIITVSNREPYIHHRNKDGVVEIQNPASGLVTALEPVMQACSGTWVAHGSGNADKDFVDQYDRVLLPPKNPLYTLRRIWLTPEEEQGYYYGFANESLWPLCHITYTRPTFRKEDWQHYYNVNKKFAESIKAEAKTDDPVVLVQDYHFALLPKMVRELLPKATIITFWHIPWPNPEIFGICPWREEILEGLLGSNIIGLHIQLHCNNFIDSVNRFLECRVDLEEATISYSGKTTAVSPYPISIEWPSRWTKDQDPISVCRKKIHAQHQLPENALLGVGVDRLDYTKGIIERFLAMERLFQLYPQWIGKFFFVQIAAPSRTSIQAYHRFELEVREHADRINQAFSQNGTYPIHLKIEHHEPSEVFEYYRAANLCLVSSLHDGMNLVAKEYIASRDDEQGVLILSYFAGASRELPEALIINPYDIDYCATTLHIALSMPDNEQRERMKSMRRHIQENNIYRWAGKMLMDAARIKQRNRLLDRVNRLGIDHKEIFTP